MSLFARIGKYAWYLILASIMQPTFGSDAPVFAYDRVAALEYAKRYNGTDTGPHGYTSKGYNPLYHHFVGVNKGWRKNEDNDWSGHDDCASFVSQCITAGNFVIRNQNGDSDPSRNDVTGKYQAFHSHVHPTASGNVTSAVVNPRVNELRYAIRWFTNRDTLSVPSEDWRKEDGLPNFFENGDLVMIRRKATQSGFDGSVFYRHIVVAAQDDGKKIWGHNPNENPDTAEPGRYTTYGGHAYLHLPDAPIIKYLKIYDDEGSTRKTYYEWKFDTDFDETSNDTTQEYFAHTYNGLSDSLYSEPGVLGAADLKVQILFDQSMDVSKYHFAFTELLSGDSFVITPDSGTNGWQKTLHADDTWKGKINLSGQQSGSYVLQVDAFSSGGGIGSQIDNDGHLNEYVPGPDSSHILRIDAAPAVMTETAVYRTTLNINGDTGPTKNGWFTTDIVQV